MDLLWSGAAACGWAGVGPDQVFAAEGSGQSRVCCLLTRAARGLRPQKNTDPLAGPGLLGSAGDVSRRTDECTSILGVGVGEGVGDGGMGGARRPLHLRGPKGGCRAVIEAS